MKPRKPSSWGSVNRMVEDHELTDTAPPWAHASWPPRPPLAVAQIKQVSGAGDLDAYEGIAAAEAGDSRTASSPALTPKEGHLGPSPANGHRTSKAS